MSSRKVLIKKEVRKYDLADLVIHHAVLILGVILMVTGLGLYAGGGRFWEVSHVWSGILFSLALLFHVAVLLVRGATRDVPMREFPFLFPISGLLSLLKGNVQVDGKFSLYERVDYFALFTLSIIVSFSGIFVRFPGLLPGSGGVTVVYSLLSIHVYSAAGFTFWVLGVHVFNSVISPLPGTHPLSIFGKVVDVEGVERHRPAWFSHLVRDGYVEVMEEKEPEEKIDREMVEALLSQGNECFRMGKLDEAEKFYREAIALYPAYSQAHYNLAIVLKKAGKLEESLTQCRKFLEVDPFNPLSSRVKRVIAEIEEIRGGGSG